MGGPAELVQGKLFIALILIVMLFGINITQTYYYYIHSKKDRLWIKLSVVVVFVADFIQPVFLSVYLYRTLIVHFGNETTISKANNLFAVVTTVTGLTANMVQIFFAWRIQILTNNWYYTVFIIAAAVSAAVCVIVVAVEASPEFVDLKSFKIVVIIGFVSEMLGDIMIASLLVWYLQTHKSGVRQFNKRVDRLILFTIQTGLLTLVFTGTDMVLYLTKPDGTYLLVDIITSKVYTCSLLSSLNSRQGGGYDTSEYAEQIELGTSELDLRFVRGESPNQTVN